MRKVNKGAGQPRGEQCKHAKLTKEAVKEIRATKSRKAMALKYGVHIRTIDKVKEYGSWWHV
jgi:hypothetical protein